MLQNEILPHVLENNSTFCTIPPPGIGNCVRIAIAVAVHHFRIAVFCYKKRCSSAEETNRVQISVYLCFSSVLLGLNFSYTCSYSKVYEQFYKTFPDYL